MQIKQLTLGNNEECLQALKKRPRKSRRKKRNNQKKEQRKEKLKEEIKRKRQNRQRRRSNLLSMKSFCKLAYQKTRFPDFKTQVIGLNSSHQKDWRTSKHLEWQLIGEGLSSQQVQILSTIHSFVGK